MLLRRAVFALAAVGMLACATSGVYGAASFRVESNAPDATVLVDDVNVGRVSEWAVAGRFIRPGFHRVEIRHPDYYAHFAEVNLREGGDVVIKAHLRPLLQ